jgi:hypothetical protein
MLPDLPSLKKEVHKKILMPLFDQSRIETDPLLSRIRYFHQFEGDRHDYQTVEGKVQELPYQRFEVNHKFTPEDVIEKGFDYILEMVSKMGQEAGSQMAQYSFQVINKSIEDVGNAVQAKGPFSKEAFLEMVEKIDIDFDEKTGKPSLPNIYIHPDQADSVRKMIQEAESDPEHKKKFDEIIERKRKEWHDREANRKLVD